VKPSRLRIFLLGLFGGVAYAFLVMLILSFWHQNVSISYILILPLILGAIPVLFSTKEQLHAYAFYLVMPWAITLLFFLLCLLAGFEGMICLVVIIAPFLVLGSLGAFIYRIIRLKQTGAGTRLYVSLLLPFGVLLLESLITPSDQVKTVTTHLMIQANPSVVWQHVKNVKHIQPGELEPHFVHLIGIPRPVNGQLDQERVGGIRSITWEKGIAFQERITSWHAGVGFTYDIKVDPASIPPQTLDEHILIGGQYFDVLAGGYQLKPVGLDRTQVTLRCTYRMTTTLNPYCAWWAHFILNDFNEMILEVIKKRSES